MHEVQRSHYKTLYFNELLFHFFTHMQSGKWDICLIMLWLFTSRHTIPNHNGKLAICKAIPDTQEAHRNAWPHSVQLVCGKLRRKSKNRIMMVQLYYLPEKCCMQDILAAITHLKKDFHRRRHFGIVLLQFSVLLRSFHLLSAVNFQAIRICMFLWCSC